MLKKAVAVFLVMAMLTSAGCEAPKEVRVPVKGNKVAGIRKGQVLRLVFEANATTGYLWELAGEEKKGIVEQAGKFRYAHKKRDVVGAGGLQIFRCEGIKRGKTKLIFEYRRPWEKDVPPAKKYTVRVSVH